VIAPVMTGVLAVCAVAIAGQWSGHRTPPSGPPRHVLRVHGKVADLVPGQARQLRIRVRNPTDAAVTIYRVRTTVRRSGKHGCPAWMLIVPRWRGHRRIAPRTRTIIQVRVRMRARAADHCQGGQWRFRYHVKGAGVGHT
jgi:hypothetical protein